MKHFLTLSALALSAFATTLPALADSFVFGGSSPDSISLTVTTTEGTVNVPTYFSGWYIETGSHSSRNLNFFVGNLGPTIYHDFFTFDLSSIEGTVQSASLNLNSFGVNNSSLYTLRDVSTAQDVLDGDNTSATGVFDDLGSGIVYGSHQYDPSQAGLDSAVNLNANAVAAINRQEGSFFSLGGSTVEGTPVAPTPEPSTLFLAGPALAGLGLIRRRLKRS